MSRGSRKTSKGGSPPIYHDFESLIQASHEGKIRLVTLREGEYPNPPKLKPIAGLTNIGFWDARDDQSWGLPEHRNRGIEISLLETGRLTYIVDGKSYEIDAGDLVITRPWQLHRVGAPWLSAGRMLWIIVDIGALWPHESWNWPSWIFLSKNNLRALTTVLRHNEHPVLHATPQMIRCCGLIGRGISEPDEKGTRYSRLIILLNELLVSLLETHQSNDKPQNPALAATERTVKLFLRHLEDRMDEPWTLSQMTEETGLGRTRLNYYCRKLTSRTPGDYLNHLRLSMAKMQLRDTTESLTQIALSCGFQTSQYFSTVFRRTEGVSPSEYRASFAKR